MPTFVPNPLLSPNSISTTMTLPAGNISSETIKLIQGIPMAQTKNEHLNNIAHHLKALKADGYKSRQAVELLLNQNERNQLGLIHRLEASVFDALHDGVSEDDIAAIDPTVEDILRDVEESLVH